MPQPTNNIPPPQTVTVDKPSTLYIRFADTMPRYFCMYDSKGRAYYFRWTDGKTPRIKFNVPDPGTYAPNVPIEVVKQTPIETPLKYPVLPPCERNRYKKSTFTVNENLKGTPAQIFTDRGEIVLSPQFFTYPPAVQKFLILHEEGHYLYKTEEYCDLFALVNFLRMGYNESTAYYTLDKILSRTPDNLKRLKFLFNQIAANSSANANFTPY